VLYGTHSVGPRGEQPRAPVPCGALLAGHTTWSGSEVGGGTHASGDSSRISLDTGTTCMGGTFNMLTKEKLPNKRKIDLFGA
ncbi:hypothetical protein BHE74_00058567, partial [Ensete ventricosum]